MLHVLKTHPPYFQRVKSGDKTFEVRKDDRDFQVNDTLELVEFDPITNEFTQDKLLAEITYKLSGGQFGIEHGYCVLAVRLI